MNTVVAAQIIQTFETGRPTGGVDTRTYLPDGAGLSFGSHQATDRSDTADKVVQTYIALGGKYAALLTSPIPSSGKSVVQHLQDDDTIQFTSTKNLPPWGQEILDRLGTAATDPIMVQAQEIVFADYYFQPAIDLGISLGLVRPLSFLALMDTTIQSGIGGVSTIRARFPELPPSKGKPEEAWTIAYIQSRYDWLATFKSSRGPDHEALVRKTKYRAASMLDLVDRDLWELPKGLRLRMPKRGVTYSDSTRRFTSNTSTILIPG